MTNHKVQHDSETKAEGQQVFSACAFIHKKDDGAEKVFLAKRADTKKFLPSVYELPGGHIDFGEEIDVGLKREIKEEFGATVELGDPFFVFSYSNEIKGSHTIEIIYFAKFVSDEKDISINLEDHSNYGWFTETELEQAATPTKGLDDIEFVAMQKGFALLCGKKLRTF